MGWVTLVFYRRLSTTSPLARLRALVAVVREVIDADPAAEPLQGHASQVPLGPWGPMQSQIQKT